MLKGKIHRARVTGADLNYEGSIEIDIWSITTGDRFSTYALPAERRSGIIALNGAAARKVQPGDEIIITAFVSMNEKEAEHWNPKIVFVDEKNRFKPLTHAPRVLANRRKLTP
jgi:aspartate 1-decarboxylase